MKSETADRQKSSRASWTHRNKLDPKGTIGIAEAALRQHNKKFRAMICGIDGNENSEE